MEESGGRDATEVTTPTHPNMCQNENLGFDLETHPVGTHTYNVTWDGPSDISNPRNWRPIRKWRNVLLISTQATLSPIASTSLAVGNLTIAHDFHLTDSYTPGLPVALFVLGFGLGPIYLAPLSEIYGRRIVYLSAFALFALFNVGCALSPNIIALSLLRLLTGMAGSAGPSLGGGSIGDLFLPEERGKAQAFYGFGPTGGSAIGGVIGGFIIEGTHGWRWMAWVMAMTSGVFALLSIFFLDETYAPFLLGQKAASLRRSTGNQAYATEFESMAPRKLFRRAITRAVRMLFTAPICTVMSIYMALIYGVLYLHLVTLPLLFSPTPIYGLPSYRWPTALTGLSYLGAGLGSFAGVLVCALFLNRSYLFMKRRAAKDPQTINRAPEYRMPIMQIGAIIVPIGLVIFALTARADVHWIAPLLGAALFATGMLIAYICVTTYLVDCFEPYGFAASALAAMTMTRSLLGCMFSFVGFELYMTLRYQWGTMLLAFFCLMMMPLPTILYFWGPRLRKDVRF